MGLLAQAKERQKQKLNKQFISYYDSVLYLGEPKDEALEFILENLRNNQTHLRLEHGELHLISVERYQDEEDEYHFTDEFIEKNLRKCINDGYIHTNNPIYNLGFAKKSFIEMIVFLDIHVSETEQIFTQSPDLAFNDEYFEVDYYTYEMIVNERDELRERLENQQPQTDSQLLQKVADQQATIDQQAKEIAGLKAQLNESQKPTSDKDVLSDRSRAGHLITIALLVDIIKTTPQGFDKRGNPLPPKYASQNKLYEKIEEYGVKGQSAKTLETRFADANKELKDIKPDHKFT